MLHAYVGSPWSAKTASPSRKKNIEFEHISVSRIDAPGVAKRMYMSSGRVAYAWLPGENS